MNKCYVTTEYVRQKKEINTALTTIETQFISHVNITIDNLPIEYFDIIVYAIDMIHDKNKER